MVVVFLCRCFSGGVVVFLCWCFWGGVLWWCFRGAVLVVVFVWWCFCDGVFVVVFLCWCFCAGVFVVWLRWCGGVGYVWNGYVWDMCDVLDMCGICVVDTFGMDMCGICVLQSTTPYYKVLLQYYSNTTLYYKVLLQYYSVLQSTTPTSEATSERRPSSTTPYYASTTKASKTSISCEASATFQGTSFQNEHFVRCFLQFSQNEVPKRAFRAMLPRIFTEKASKRIVSCEASSKFHRRSFQNERFVRGFLQNSQNHASKTSVSHDASDNFHEKFAFRYSFTQSTHRFLREGSSAKSKMCFALQRRAFPNVTMCVSPQRRVQKCMNLSTVNRPASRTQKCEVLLQFWAIDTTFLPRGLTRRK